jgi:hypothetical protein
MATKVHTVKLNDSAFEHAKKLIAEGKAVLDQRDDWSEHQPTAQQENRFIAEHGMAEYARWHLGIDEEKTSDVKGRYKFPCGDFSNVHRCAVLSAESRAGQYKHTDIELACAHLHGMLDALM